MPSGSQWQLIPCYSCASSDSYFQWKPGTLNTMENGTVQMYLVKIPVTRAKGVKGCKETKSKTATTARAATTTVRAAANDQQAGLSS